MTDCYPRSERYNYLQYRAVLRAMVMACSPDDGSLLVFLAAADFCSLSSQAGRKLWPKDTIPYHTTKTQIARDHLKIATVEPTTSSAVTQCWPVGQQQTKSQLANRNEPELFSTGWKPIIAPLWRVVVQRLVYFPAST